MRNLDTVLDTVCATGKTYREEIPESTIDSLERYRINGIPTGSFLRAFMSGDLFAMAITDAATLTTTIELPQWQFGKPQQIEATLFP